MSYKAVLFDLDGTLLDTLEDLADSCNRSLAALEFPTHPVDSYKTFVGEGVQKLIHRALPPDKRDPETMQRCLDVYKIEYGRGWNVKTRPYRGIPEMLDGLVARGIRLAVLSNKPDVFTQQCVKQLMPTWTFEVIMGASAKFPHKPDPASALDVARQMNVPASQFLYLGDTAVDMQTANAAGMFAVGALWGFRSKQELQESGARVLIEKPQELLGLLG